MQIIKLQNFLKVRLKLKVFPFLLDNNSVKKKLRRPITFHILRDKQFYSIYITFTFLESYSRPTVKVKVKLSFPIF